MKMCQLVVGCRPAFQSLDDEVVESVAAGGLVIDYLPFQSDSLSPTARVVLRRWAPAICTFDLCYGAYNNTMLFSIQHDPKS